VVNYITDLDRQLWRAKGWLGVMHIVTRAHAALDDAGAPREIDGQVLSLTGRIQYLNGRLSAARDVALVGLGVEK
jgi:hypothetical protein